jgi:hypothetical protein
MMPTSLLALKEGAETELKAADALGRPEIIGRAVVAFCNGKGGTVFVGVREDGLGRAKSIDGVREAERARIALRDHLVDTIEPSPSSEELSTKVISAGEVELLQVEVLPQATKRPYAQLRNGGRFFWIRVEDRVRHMTREELARAFLDASKADSQGASHGLRRARKLLANGRNAVLAEKHGVFWIRVQPVSAPRGFDVQRPELRDYLQHAEATGNRPNGWHFASEYEEPRLTSGGWVQGKGDRLCAVQRDGAVDFRMPLEDLHWKGPPKSLWPYALLEYPTSVLRLAATIYRSVDVAGLDALLDLALTHVEGWRLFPGSPRDLAYAWGPSQANAFDAGRDLVLARPLEMGAAEIATEPDGCAFRLVRLVYQGFGHTEDRVPAEFDRAARRLVLR